MAVLFVTSQALARFSFSGPVTPAGASPPQDLTVKVFPPGTEDDDGVQPFFACKLTPWRWMPPVLVNIGWVPINMMHVQPSIPEPAGRKTALAAELEDRKSGTVIDPYGISAKKEVAVAAGTDRWCAFDIGGKVREREAAGLRSLMLVCRMARRRSVGHRE